MKQYLNILFLVFNLVVFSQDNTKAYYRIADSTNVDSTIEYSHLQKIEDPTLKSFEGNYHFGEGEGASTLEFLYSNEKLFVRNGAMAYTGDEFDDNAEWVLKRENITFTDGKIKISSEVGIVYELYMYTGDSKNIKKDTKGLVYSLTQTKDEQEFTCFIFNDSDALKKPKGKYPEVSFVELTKKDLKKYSKSELSLMRNEIFAREGHIFLEGGKMESYFSEQEWYTPIKQVNERELTSFEQKNIKLIKSLE